MYNPQCNKKNYQLYNSHGGNVIAATNKTHNPALRGFRGKEKKSAKPRAYYEEL